MADDCKTRILTKEVLDKIFGEDRQIPPHILEHWLDGIDQIKKAFDEGHLSSGQYNKKLNDYITERRVTAELQAQVDLASRKNIKRSNAFLDQPGFQGRIVEGFHGMMDKTVTLANGGALSVNARQSSMKIKYAEFAHRQLTADGLMELAMDKTGPLDHEIGQVLDSLNHGIDVSATLRPESIKIGQVMHDMTQMGLMDLRDVGMPVQFLKSRVGLQTHNPTTIREAGFDKWYEKVVSLKPDTDVLGPQASTPEGLKKTLQAIYKEIVAGRYDGMQARDGELVDSVGPGRISEKNLKHRALVFSAENHVQYMKEFGAANTLMQSLWMDLSAKAKAAALFEKFGDQPQKNFEGMINRQLKKFEDAGDEKSFSALEAQVPRLKAEFKAVAAVKDISVDNVWHKIDRANNAVQVASKLGTLGIRSLPNFVTAAVDAQSSAGVSAGDALTGIFKESIKGLPDAVRSVWSKRYGNVLTTLNRQLQEKAMGGDWLVTQGASHAATFQMRLFGQDIWNEALSTAQASVILMDWADHAGKPFDQLNPRMQAGLLTAGVSKNGWKVLSKAVRTLDNGDKIISPEMLSQGWKKGEPPFDTAEIEAAMAADKFSGNVGSYMRGLENNTRAFLLQRGNVATTTAGPREGTLFRAGAESGTPWGTFVGMMAQFKSFTAQGINIMKNVANSAPDPELLAKGVASTKRGFDYSSAGLMAQLAVLGMFTAFGANMLKSAVTGKEQPDPRRVGDWVKAFGDSSIGGMQVDFLTADRDDRTGRAKFSFAETILGPTLGTIAGAGQDMLLSGERLDGKAFTKQAIRVGRSVIPMQNAPGVKSVLDYAQRRVLNETMSPEAQVRQIRKSREAQ